MNKLRVAFLAACFLVGFSLALLSAVNMQDGSWEMTMTTEMTGMPFKMPPIKYTVCLTKSNPNPQKEDSKCKVISSKISGSTYTWIVECQTSNGPAKSDGSITYKGSTMDGIINMTTQGMVMKQTISGKYVGPCSK